MPFTNRKVKYLGRYTDDPASGQTNECLVETRGCGEDSNIERGTFASCAFPPFDLLPVPLPGVCASSTTANTARSSSTTVKHSDDHSDAHWLAHLTTGVLPQDYIYPK